MPIDATERAARLGRVAAILIDLARRSQETNNVDDSRPVADEDKET